MDNFKGRAGGRRFGKSKSSSLSICKEILWITIILGISFLYLKIVFVKRYYGSIIFGISALYQKKFSVCKEILWITIIFFSVFFVFIALFTAPFFSVFLFLLSHLLTNRGSRPSQKKIINYSL